MAQPIMGRDMEVEARAVIGRRKASSRRLDRAVEVRLGGRNALADAAEFVELPFSRGASRVGGNVVANSAMEALVPRRDEESNRCNEPPGPASDAHESPRRRFSLAERSQRTGGCADTRPPISRQSRLLPGPRIRPRSVPGRCSEWSHRRPAPSPAPASSARTDCPSGELRRRR